MRLQDNELSHDVSAGVIVSNRSLVLQRVRRTHSGTFTCHAENAEDAASSNGVELKVKCECSRACHFYLPKIVHYKGDINDCVIMRANLMHKSTLSWLILCEYQGCVRAWCGYPGFPVLNKSVEAPYTESDVGGAGEKEVASFKRHVRVILCVRCTFYFDMQLKVVGRKM